MPMLPDCGRSFDPRTDIPHRSSSEIKQEIYNGLVNFVERFNHENEANLTVEELQGLEQKYPVHHVLHIMELYGSEFRPHLDDKPGESLHVHQGGWIAQWEAEN